MIFFSSSYELKTNFRFFSVYFLNSAVGRRRGACPERLWSICILNVSNLDCDRKWKLVGDVNNSFFRSFQKLLCETYIFNSQTENSIRHFEKNATSMGNFKASKFISIALFISLFILHKYEKDWRKTIFMNPKLYTSQQKQSYFRNHIICFHLLLISV